jgi:serine phosphatase RsbU (regulator of sigma subunit)
MIEDRFNTVFDVFQIRKTISFIDLIFGGYCIVVLILCLLMWSMGHMSLVPAGGITVFLLVNFSISLLSKSRAVNSVIIEWVRSVIGPGISIAVFFLTREISHGWWVGFLIMCLGGNIFHTIVTMSSFTGRIMVALYGTSLFICHFFQPVVDWGAIVSQVGAVVVGGLVFTEMLAELADSLFKQVLQKDEIEHQKMRVEEQRLLIEQKNAHLEQIYLDITDSIRYAKRIQIALTPMANNLKGDVSDFFLLNKPKDIVSGDFFWSAKKNGYLFLIVADCTGHGVPGAILTVIGNTLLNTTILERGLIDPVEVMYAVDAGLSQIFHSQNDRDEDLTDGMDMAVVRLDPTQKELIFIGAKRNGFFSKNGSLHEFRGCRYSLGKDQGIKKTFVEEKQTYSQGDVVYLFSDGYTDQFGGPENKKFLKHRFKELINEIQSQNLTEQHSILSRKLKDWQDVEPQTDDILVAGIKL